MSQQSYSVPIAEQVPQTEDADQVTDGPPVPGPAPIPGPIPIRIPKLCVVPLPDGCYRLTFTKNNGTGSYRGTLRVDRATGTVAVSGDLYWFPTGTDAADGPDVPISLTPLPLPKISLAKFGIPIYPRKRYHSYLKGTAVRLLSAGSPCKGSITFEQYDYTQPPAGAFNGSFPAAPGSRTAQITFSKSPAAPSFLWPGNYYEGEWTEGGVSKGTITIGWVSSSFRRCTIEVDTLVDAVAPQPVPALSGSGNEDFKTMLASAGWAANVVYDQAAIPKPAGVANHKACWSDGNLHALMQAVRKPGTDLDAEWRLHLVVVPGAMGCSRGKMYDSIDVPREGVVSYSDDGYPLNNSTNFGIAQDKMQRDVPRAFIRSASHELVHGFNQIHQEQESGADNSIMTTTPSVADVLAGPATGDPGVFPTDIKLQVNALVRRHLVHFPDPVVRPGGHTFASWASVAVPQAGDRFEVGPENLTLDVMTSVQRVELGEPVAVEWVLTNVSDRDAAVPSEVTHESTYAKITVIDAGGRRKEVTPFVIVCEETRIERLPAGGTLTAGSRVYWSNNGFAFERPGRYTVEVAIEWTVSGIPLTLRGTTAVFVNYPKTDTDNAAAAKLLHPEVGKWVALGGGADHLLEAVSRLQDTMDLIGVGDVADEAADRGEAAALPGALRGYDGLLPA